MKGNIELIEVISSDEDGLTKIVKRDILEKKLDKSISSNDNSGFYSVILFDIDYFKSFNDLYSHEQGDSILEGIGSILNRLMM